MDTNRLETRFEDETVLSIDCIAIEDEYGSTPARRSELGWLLYNKPLEYSIAFGKNAQPAPERCRSERVWDFPTSILQRKICICAHECTACYNGVGSEKFTASELYRCPNLSYNEDVLRERSIA